MPIPKQTNKNKIPNCFECGLPAHHRHHVVPRIMGGKKTVPLCESCHGKIHNLDFTNHNELVKLALANKQKKGEYVGGVPYGYKMSKDKIHLEIVNQEQKIIKLARKLFAQGLSFRAITKNINDSGYLGRNAKPFHASLIWNIINFDIDKCKQYFNFKQ